MSGRFDGFVDFKDQVARRLLLEEKLDVASVELAQFDSLQRAELVAWLQEDPDMDLLDIDSCLTLADVFAVYVDEAARPGAMRDAPPPAGGARLAKYSLLPVANDQLPALYRLAVDNEVGYRWRFRGAVPTYEQFVESFWAGTLVQFVAVEGANLLGHVVAYNYDPVQGFVYAGMISTPTYVGTGRPIEVLADFYGYLFKTWPIRKIYMEVPAFNYAQFASGAGRQYDVEGVLKDHDYYDGEYWDHYLLAVYRRHVS